MFRYPVDIKRFISHIFFWRFKYRNPFGNYISRTEYNWLRSDHKYELPSEQNCCIFNLNWSLIYQKSEGLRFSTASTIRTQTFMFQEMSLKTSDSSSEVSFYGYVLYTLLPETCDRRLCMFSLSAVAAMLLRPSNFSRPEAHNHCILVPQEMSLIQYKSFSLDTHFYSSHFCQRPWNYLLVFMCFYALACG